MAVKICADSKISWLTSAIYNSYFINRHITDVTADLGPEVKDVPAQLRFVNTHLEAFSMENRIEQATIAAKLYKLRLHYIPKTS